MIRILLIEDDGADALLFNRVLANCAGDYESHHCGSLDDAMGWLDRHSCDAVVLDLSLPDSSGLESIQAIHSVDAGIPIVMLTGLDDDAVALDALEKGAQDYLIKGEANARELARTLRHAIQRQQIQNENRRLLAELKRAARSDSLTGVLNRHAMIEHFERHWLDTGQQRQPLSCVILDVDHFKHINDRYGHLAGDEVLRKLATLVDQRTRDNDCIARYGGEEFCVVLVDATQQQALDWSEQVRQELAQTTFELGEDTLQVTASFGVAQRCNATRSIEELIDLADQALMIAKGSGRDQVHALSRESGEEIGNGPQTNATSSPITA